MSQLKTLSRTKIHTTTDCEPLPSNSDSPHTGGILVEQRLPDDLIFDIATIVNSEMPGLMMNLIRTVCLNLYIY
jgi:hypothetical protein